MTDTEKYAEKIQKLLRKAETTTPEEAESLVEKAQELMTRYAISDAMLEAAQEGERREIVEVQVEYRGIYSVGLYEIGSAIAKANGCRTLIRKGRSGTTMWLIGFEDDVERAQMLDASLQIQATSALSVWWRGAREEFSWMTKMDQFKSRRDFYFGFAGGLRQQLNAARQRGEDEAVKAEAARTDTSEQEASDSVALVLRSKKERINEWVDEKYGSTLRSVSNNYSSGLGGYGAGSEAGRNADTGRPKVSRSRGALPR